jgi:hypothetical protein
MSLAGDSNEHTIESVDRVLTSEGLMPAISYLEADLKTLKDSCGSTEGHAHISQQCGQSGPRHEERGVHPEPNPGCSGYQAPPAGTERSGSNARGPLLFWISLGLGIALLAGYMLWRVM